MELKYIWIKKYKILENVGVNFSNTGEHEFAFDGDNLNLNKKPHSILDFGPKISSITAIAGQNGSGKSSLCEIIIHTMATFNHGALGWDIKFEGIVCFGKYVFHDKKTKIKNSNFLKQNGYELFQFKNSPLEVLHDFYSISKDFNSVGFIYYSNVIDWRSGFNEMNLSNISTQYLLRNDVEYTSEYTDRRRGNNLPEHYKGKDQVDTYSAYGIEEAQRIAKFSLNFNDFLPFQWPDRYLVHSSYSGNNKWLSLHALKDIDVNFLNEYEQSIFESLYSKYSPITKHTDPAIKINKRLLKNSIIELYKLNLLKIEVIESKKAPDRKKTHEFIFGTDNFFDFFRDSRKVKELVHGFRNLVNYSGIDNEFRPYFYQNSLQISGVSDWRFQIIPTMVLATTPKNRKLMKKFLGLEEEILRNNSAADKRISTLNIDPAPSTGEYSFLSLFSRIYQIIERNQLGIDNRETFVLFIDEADISFHPAWKKRMVLWLNEFFNMAFNPYSFQIILTTHSPYLLSDLDSQNVLLLNKSRTGKTKIVDSNSFNTFSANIHELLAESFFLEDGSIGEFARKTIESLIKYLQGKNDNQSWNKEKAREVIDIIGDTIIKDRLNDLYTNKFPETKMSLREEQNELKKRLKQINIQLKNDTN